ncbi:MAG: hypothetical protein ACR2PM_19270 [Hyphomicrobiales bacterium]
MARAKPKDQPDADRDTRQGTAFAAAIQTALEEPDGDETKLHRVAQTLVALAIEGNMSAIKEISDRLDGKPSAPQAGEKPDANSKQPIEVQVRWLKS